MAGMGRKQTSAANGGNGWKADVSLAPFTLVAFRAWTDDLSFS